MIPWRNHFRVGIDARNAAGAILAGAAGGLAFPPVDLWPFAILSQWAFLVLLREKDPGEARNVGLLYGLAHAGATMYWLFNVFGRHAVSLLAIQAAYFGLLGHLVATTRSLPPMARAACVACFALAVEWLRGDAWTIRFPWYTVPHALAGNPVLVAPARFLGTYGLSVCIWFLLGLGGFGLRRALWALVPLLLLGLIVREPAPPDRRAMVLQAEGPSQIEKVIPDAGGDSVSLAVLPEYAFFFSPEMALFFPNGPTDLAQRIEGPVVFGAVDGEYGTKTFQNVAVVAVPEGETSARITGRFPKQRPVPFMLDGRAGRVRPVFPVAGGILGVAVCYDFDAPEVSASLVRSGATVLISPTFDAMAWGHTQHLHHERLLRLRAAELDRWIVRAASSGRSESIDPRGRPSAQGVEIGETGFAIVPFAHRSGVPPAAYAPWLGPISAGLSLLLLLRRVRVRGT